MLFGADIGWRLAFGIGAFLGLGILFLRRWVPESPRWLMTHGQVGEAERIVSGIEAQVAAEHGRLPPPGHERATIHLRKGTRLRAAFRTIFVTYRQRAVLGFVLLVSQAFFYNAIFFSYGLILVKYYAIPPIGSASIFCRSRSATSSVRSFSAGCSTPSAASR